jgi:hypothetical protein
MNKRSNSHTNKRQKPGKSTLPKIELLDKMENYFSKRRRSYLLLCLLSALIFSFLLFNINITDSADDSTYIEAGYKYASGFFDYYYTSNAPLYCMFLALPIAIFGLNLVVLKLFSALFFVLGIFCLYIALKDRVRYIVLFPALLLTAINSLFLYYASQTFTEAFVLPLTGLFLLTMFNLDEATQSGADLKKNLRKFLWLGFMTFIMYLARNVATAAVIIVFAYFMIYRKYLTAIYSACSFALFWGVYQKIIVPLLWGHLNPQNSLNGQISSIFVKNTYNPSLGQEDLGGLIARFFENAKIYSSQFFELIGIKSVATPHSYLFFALILVLLGISAGYAIAKKQKCIIAIILYVTMFLCVTFISLTTMWKQARLVMIYIPLIIVGVAYGITMLLKAKNLKLFQWIYPAGIIILLLLNLSSTTEKVRDHLPTLRKNIEGDRYYGFTPDWINYFRASEWAAENIAREDVIACRKASMSFIYSHGRNFMGITSVPTIPSDSALVSANYEHHFLGIASADIPANVVQRLYPYTVTLFVGNNNIYYTYDLPEPLYAEMTGSGVPLYTKLEDFAVAIKKIENNYGVSPDKLVEFLKNKNVSHIIDANLRTNPSVKTENTINTVTRYMNFIEQKYPGTFLKIYQIGTENNEPAMIYKIHYPETEN